MSTCRKCQATINQDTKVCPFCGAEWTAQASCDSAAPASKSSATRITLILAIVLTILWAVAWFVLPWRLSGSKPDSEAQARDALAAIQEVLSDYQRSEGSFPSSLDALGDRVRAAGQKAQTARYTLQYTPGKSTADGLIKSFTLIACSKNIGYLNFYTDESGVFRATVEARPATIKDPPLRGNF